MLTKKDYVAIAEAIKNEPTGNVNPYDVKSGIAYSLSRILAKANPLFNASKFLIACGIED